MMRRMWSVVVFAGVMAVGSTCWAQDGVIVLEESAIKGRIQKPEAFYILQHANPDYERLNSKPSFIPELIESVEEEPF
jgi:hypothetical protein